MEKLALWILFYVCIGEAQPTYTYDILRNNMWILIIELMKIENNIVSHLNMTVNQGKK